MEHSSHDQHGQVRHRRHSPASVQSKITARIVKQQPDEWQRKLVDFTVWPNCEESSESWAVSARPYSDLTYVVQRVAADTHVSGDSFV
jgi:hypothetical protein